MTVPFRSLYGIVFTAMLALSLVATTQDAIAKTTGTTMLPGLFDPGFVNSVKHGHRQLGHLGVSWE